MKLSKKGFTLIEIIVSIAIGSIVLLIAGAIILSSSNFLMTTTEMDMDKRCVDSVVDFVRSEILYATDARLMLYNADNAPTIGDEEGWHCFYVKDKVLYRDDSKVYSDDFYSHKELKFSAKGNYQNGSRVDLFYELWNASHEKTYSTKDTVMLLNVQVTDEIKSEGLFTQQKRELTDTGYALYYKKGNSSSNSGEETGLTGTVADIQMNLSGKNFRGIYDENVNYNYINGEIVWYKGYWWERVSYTDMRAPGTDFGWKCLTSEYCAKSINGIDSSYEAGDVVIYNNQYYIALVDVLSNDGTQYHNFITDTRVWECKGSIDDPNTIAWAKSHVYQEKKPYSSYQTIVTKYWPIEHNIKDVSRNGYSEFTDTKVYNENDIVKKQSTLDPNYYDLYIKKANFDTNLGPGNPTSGWIKIDNVYDSGSSYMHGDEVLCIIDGNPWIRAKKDILVTQKPQDEIYTNHVYWEKIDTN